MLYIYRRYASIGARDLVEGILLTGTRARRTKGLKLRELVAGDAVVCWGDCFTAPAGIRTLNNVPGLSKFSEAERLKEKGVPTVQVSRTKPVVVAAPGVKPAFVEGALAVQAGRFNLADATLFAARLQDFIREQASRRAVYDATPAPPGAPIDTWLPRRNNHVGGNDLLAENLQQVDFYSKKEALTEEYRLHIFRGKSIRAGRKVARATRPDGRTAPHQWIRSFDAGWSIQYDGFESTKALRDIAKKAVKALGLDFAAVDIGKKADGSFIVLEVNRAPGVENNTVTTYATNIAHWFANPAEVAEE